MSESRYIIGIDLGTTNIAVCYIDTDEGDDYEIQSFPIPQLTAAGEIDSRPLLPSFCLSTVHFFASVGSQALEPLSKPSLCTS